MKNISRKKYLPFNFCTLLTVPRYCVKFPSNNRFFLPTVTMWTFIHAQTLFLLFLLSRNPPLQQHVLSIPLSISIRFFQDTRTARYHSISRFSNDTGRYSVLEGRSQLLVDTVNCYRIFLLTLTRLIIRVFSIAKMVVTCFPLCIAS